MFDTDLLNVLVCPVGKKKLVYESNFVICTNCGLKFPIVDDIPVLMIDEAILPEGIKSREELPCISNS